LRIGHEPVAEMSPALITIVSMYWKITLYAYLTVWKNAMILKKDFKINRIPTILDFGFRLSEDHTKPRRHL
jgi:hypothetical protein